MPMLKSPIFWISSDTLTYGSVLEVDDRLGHQLLAAYPEAFEILTYTTKEEEKPKKRTKQVTADQINEV